MPPKHFYYSAATRYALKRLAPSFEQSDWAIIRARADKAHYINRAHLYYLHRIALAMRLISAITLLVFAYHARAQNDDECPQITKEILTTTDEFTGSTLVVQAFNPGINPQDPFIIVHDIHIVCQAVGERRDTYRSVSVLVRQNCSGHLCPANDVVQYDFECSFGKWTARDTNIVDDEPEADFDTELREDCGVCSRTTVGAEPITHCRSK